jgi:hypothetical protein
MAAAIAAAGLLLAGAAAWSMTAGVPACPANHICFMPVTAGHRLHPLRAELLWAASALFALIAVTVAAGRLRASARPAAS